MLSSIVTVLPDCTSCSCPVVGSAGSVVVPAVGPSATLSSVAVTCVTAGGLGASDVGSGGAVGGNVVDNGKWSCWDGVGDSPCDGTMLSAGGVETIAGGSVEAAAVRGDDEEEDDDGIAQLSPEASLMSCARSRQFCSRAARVIFTPDGLPSYLPKHPTTTWPKCGTSWTVMWRNLLRI